MVVNAFGDLLDAEVPALPPSASWPEVAPGVAASIARHTTIGVVATNAALPKPGCLLVAQSAHDGLARALEPAHTLLDGDAVVAASAGREHAPLELVRALAARAVHDAIVAGVAAAR
jgi:L-aminopeptidase/D-esterase-like protein